MVNVGAKPETARLARAAARVRLPATVAAHLRDGDLSTRKGSVLQTAILAGITGAKQTSALIPLCHPLPLTDCAVTIELHPPAADGSVIAAIECRAETVGRTGVEMEAMTGASIAALTLYDMAKGLSHEIVIESVRLLEKTGGKHAFGSAEARP